MSFFAIVPEAKKSRSKYGHIVNRREQHSLPLFFFSFVAPPHFMGRILFSFLFAMSHEFPLFFIRRPGRRKKNPNSPMLYAGCGKSFSVVWKMGEFFSTYSKWSLKRSCSHNSASRHIKTRERGFLCCEMGI